MQQLKNLIIGVLLAGALVACSSKPLVPYSTQTPPLALVPVTAAGVDDERGRFREIFCTVLEERGEQLPDYRPCARALLQFFATGCQKKDPKGLNQRPGPGEVSFKIGDDDFRRFPHVGPGLETDHRQDRVRFFPPETDLPEFSDKSNQFSLPYI